jgi:hypothetical protein
MVSGKGNGELKLLWCLMNQNAMKKHGREEVRFHAFLTSAVDGAVSFDSSPLPTLPEAQLPGNKFLEICGQQATLKVDQERQKFLDPSGIRKSSVHSPVTTLTDLLRLNYSMVFNFSK